jgi:hypothetical protein
VSRSFVIFANPGRWLLAAVDDAARTQWIDLPDQPSASLEESVGQVTAAMNVAGYRHNGVVLAIPSSWCFAAATPLAGLARRDRRSMLFRLEEKLPLAAEEIVADFTDDSVSPLAVCARLDELRPIVDALENRGVVVESVSPTAMLAAQALASADAPQILRLPCGHGVDVISTLAAKPIAWSVSMPDDSDIALHIEMARRVFGEATVVDPAKTDPFEVAAQTAASALKGRTRLWFDLRRDALAEKDSLRRYRKSLNSALAAASVLLLVIAGTLILRSIRYDRLVRDNERKLTETFTREFPGWSIPASIPAVVESEHRKLLALQAGATKQASSESALRLLVQVLGALPSDSALDVQRMSFDERGFSLVGRIAAPQELDSIISAIRSTGLRVAPPESRRDEHSTWTFNLRGEPAESGATRQLTEVR